jgi:hypothetical protein
MEKYRYRFDIHGFGIYRKNRLIAEYHNFRLDSNGKVDCDIKYHVDISKPMKCFNDLAKSRLFRLWRYGGLHGHFGIGGNVPFPELSQDWKNLILHT